MFTITATRDITWPHFALVKGKNDFLTRKEIPAELWPKLGRFRQLKLVEFEGDAEAGKEEPLKVEELTERQIYDLDKVQLAELAKSAGVLLAADSSKKALIDALVPKAKPAMTFDEPAEAAKVEAAKVEAAKVIAKKTDKPSLPPHTL
jgi:hypothetical protein